MHTTTDIMEGTSGVELLSQIIQISYEARELHTVGPELLVHRRPGNDAGVVTVANNLLCPLSREVTSHLRVIGIHTPRGSLAPSDITQLVCPIVEALLEDLLVQTGTIEACLHRELNIMLESLIRGSRPDTIRIEPLVENQTLVEGLVVEVCLVAYAMEFSHANIRRYLIYNITLRILYLVGKVVEEGTLRTPQLRSLDGQDDC